jgi:hypothetical protein
LATDRDFQAVKEQMKTQLLEWMSETGDPRATDPKSTYWDQVRYTPNYQMEDAPIQQRIEAYRILSPFGRDSKEGIGCLEE